VTEQQLRGKGAFPMGNDIDAVAEIYGDPAAFKRAPFAGRFPDAQQLDEGRWKAATLSALAVPFPSALRISGTKVLARQVYPHRLVRESLVDVFTELITADAWRYVRDYAGMYCYRLRRGGSSLSMHSWGAAIDFNAERYPLGCPPDRTDPFVTEVVPVFERHGWVWGGRWSRPDAMHFQATTGA
jgi:hypothetical protein